MPNTYLDPYVFQRAATGHDTSTLIGNLGRLAVSAAGAARFTLLTPLSVALNQYDALYVFDGAASEVLQVGAGGAAVGATSIPLQAAAASDHAAGTVYASDGAQGSLPQCILDASADVEGYCRQPLLAATIAAETLPLRSMRASVTRDGQLIVRPRQFPVTAVSAVTLAVQGMTTLTLSTDYVQLDADGHTVTLTQLSSASGSATLWGAYASPAVPTTPGFVTLSYTAGFPYVALPYDIRQAAIWLTSDLLSDRRNPTGAAEVQQGKTHVVTRLRGDTSGESTLTLRAHARLDRYRQKAM